MVIVSILPHAEFGWNDHQERAPHFILRGCNCVGVTMWSGLKFLAEWFSAFLSVRYSDLNFPDRYLQHATSIIFWIIEPKSSLLDKKIYMQEFGAIINVKNPSRPKVDLECWNTVIYIRACKQYCINDFPVKRNPSYSWIYIFYISYIYRQGWRDSIEHFNSHILSCFKISTKNASAPLPANFRCWPVPVNFRSIRYWSLSFIQLPV